ncbi:hypothetical protein [Caulobacter sp. 17J65-9]|uniref:hypothetical protein n=1 Tax=Caulobacter sp. 17J65-9 TaxID=2709382 RepID=UPI001969CBEC
METKPYDVDTWRFLLKAFSGRVAKPEDVDSDAAVFALGDTENGRVIDMELPQPVIWWNDDEEIGAVVVQAEAHETDDGEVLEVLGLALPDGETAVAFLDDVDLVDDTDPVWRGLIDQVVGEDAYDDEDEDGDDEDLEVFDEDDDDQVS